MSAEERDQLVEFLRSNSDVFAWQPYDMPGSPVDVMCHKLYIDPNYRPVKQKPCQATPEKAKAVEEEMQKLLKAGAI